MEATEVLEKIYKLDPNFDLKEYLQKHLDLLIRKEELNAYCDWIAENMD